MPKKNLEYFQNSLREVSLFRPFATLKTTEKNKESVNSHF